MAEDIGITDIVKTEQKIHQHYSFTKAGFNANDEFILFDLDSFGGSWRDLPNFAWVQVTRTSGADDIIEANLEGSFDGTNWVELISFISVTGGTTIPLTKQYIEPYTNYRFNIVDVGASGVLTAEIGLASIKASLNA